MCRATPKVSVSKFPQAAANKQLSAIGATIRKLFVDRRGAGFANIPNYNQIYEAPLPARNKRVKLHLLLDADSVELFGNQGEAVISAKTLLDPHGALDLELFAAEGEAKLVSLKIYPLHRVWRSDEESPC